MHEYVQNKYSILRSVATRLTRLVKRLRKSQSSDAYHKAQLFEDSRANKAFVKAVVDLGPSCHIRHPVYFKNPKYFSIGSNFSAGPGLRIEAWDNYEGDSFVPEIIIGNSVAINWNVHIGAINRIEIQDNVLIGSNVLITDHAHGNITLDD